MGIAVNTPYLYLLLIGIFIVGVVIFTKYMNNKNDESNESLYNPNRGSTTSLGESEEKMDEGTRKICDNCLYCANGARLSCVRNSYHKQEFFGVNKPDMPKDKYVTATDTCSYFRHWDS